MISNIEINQEQGYLAIHVKDIIPVIKEQNENESKNKLEAKIDKKSFKEISVCSFNNLN